MLEIRGQEWPVFMRILNPTPCRSPLLSTVFYTPPLKIPIKRPFFNGPARQCRVRARLSRLQSLLVRNRYQLRKIADRTGNSPFAFLTGRKILLYACRKTEREKSSFPTFEEDQGRGSGYFQEGHKSPSGGGISFLPSSLHKYVLESDLQR